MKNFFYLIVMSLILTGCAGMETIPDTDRTFFRVVDMQGMSKDQIFNGSREWIAENFKSSKKVIEYEDKASGVIIGNGIISYPCAGGMDCFAKGDWQIPFTMRIDTKDSKFRITFSDISLIMPPSPGFAGFEGLVRQKGDMEVIRPKLLSFGDEIGTYMKKGKASSDW